LQSAAERFLMDFHAVLFAMVALVVVYLVSQVITHGGFRGAMFHARVARTVGEIDLGRRRMAWRTARVHLLQAGDGSTQDVGIEFRSKALGRSGGLSLALTADQVRALTVLLSEAASQAESLRR
jgi:hypothetical protein